MWNESLFLFQFAHVLLDGLVYFLKASQITCVFVGHGIHTDCKKVWLNKAWPMRMTDSTTSFTIDLSHFQLWYRQSWRKIHRGSDGSNRLRFVAIDERFLSYGPTCPNDREPTLHMVHQQDVCSSHLLTRLSLCFSSPHAVENPNPGTLHTFMPGLKGSNFHVLARSCHLTSFTPPSSPDVHLRLPTVGQDVRLDNRIIDLRTVWAWRGCTRERMEWVMLVDDDDDDDDVWSLGWLIGWFGCLVGRFGMVLL